MNKAQPFNIVIAACALAVGLLGLGFILKSASLDVKGMERTVHVKGLAEMEVPADTVIWPLQFSDADNNLEKLVIETVNVLETDGSLGYEKESPYDRIIVTAASPEIKEEWITQLKEGGILVLPLGNHYTAQTMTKIINSGERLIQENHGYFKFVPLRTDRNK